MVSLLMANIKHISPDIRFSELKSMQKFIEYDERHTPQSYVNALKTDLYPNICKYFFFRKCSIRTRYGGVGHMPGGATICN